jgi:hypothetical protein
VGEHQHTARPGCHLAGVQHACVQRTHKRACLLGWPRKLATTCSGQAQAALPSCTWRLGGRVECRGPALEALVEVHQERQAAPPVAKCVEEVGAIAVQAAAGPAGAQQPGQAALKQAPMSAQQPGHRQRCSRLPCAHSSRGTGSAAAGHPCAHSS